MKVKSVFRASSDQDSLLLPGSYFMAPPNDSRFIGSPGKRGETYVFLYTFFNSIVIYSGLHIYFTWNREKPAPAETLPLPTDSPKQIRSPGCHLKQGEEIDPEKKKRRTSEDSSWGSGDSISYSESDENECHLESLNASADALIVTRPQSDEEYSSDSCELDSSSDSDFTDIELNVMIDVCANSNAKKEEERPIEKKVEELAVEKGSKPKRGEAIKKCLKWIGVWLMRIFQIPTIAIILGVLIGVCPFLKRELITHPRYIVAGFTNAVVLLGNAAPSFIIIILGIGLANMPNLKSIDKWGVIMSVVGKQVIVAALSVPVVAGMYYGGVLPEDPVVALTLLVEGSTPSATNLIVICQLTDMPVEFASAVLFVQYLCAPVLVALSTVGYVYLSASVFV